MAHNAYRLVQKNPDAQTAPYHGSLVREAVESAIATLAGKGRSVSFVALSGGFPLSSPSTRAVRIYNKI